jgi:hypothetical protein
MGFQGETKCRWWDWLLLLGWGGWLWRNFCTFLKIFFSFGVARNRCYDGFQNSSNGWKINIFPWWVQGDCLHGATIWIIQLERFICKLEKTIYGFRQTSWVWNKRIDGFLKQKGFKQCKYDTSIYVLMEREQDAY